MLSANSLGFKGYIYGCLRLLLPRFLLEKQVKQLIATHLQVEPTQLVLTDTGRSALRLLLAQLDADEGCEVIVPAFTCVVVPNQVQAYGLKVRFVDVDAQSLNFNQQALEAALNDKTCAVIVPHNFGLPSEINPELKIRYPQVAWIDDACHGFATKVGDVSLGTQNEGAFFSFEYSKPITGGIGGVAVFPKNATVPTWDYPDVSAWQQLQILSTLKAHVYTAKSPQLGRIVMGIIRRLGLIYRSEDAEVVQGQAHAIAKMPKVALAMLIHQLCYIPATKRHKQTLAKRYTEVLTKVSQVQCFEAIENADVHWVRFPFVLKNIVGNKHEIAQRLSRQSGLSIGVWFDDEIHPKNSYRHGLVAAQVPEAHQLAQSIFNLPMNINLASDEKLDAHLAQLVIAIEQEYRQLK